MPAIRILVVDDSPFMRRIVTELFVQESEFEVVGSAENGREALTRIHLLNPHLVILDVEMPVMDGWKTLEAIRVSYPELAVIIFSTLDPDADGIAQRTTALGARAFVRKPRQVEDRESAWQHLRDNLLRTVKEQSIRA
jgi:two-component system chemotaxis response regulator CheB